MCAGYLLTTLVYACPGKFWSDTCLNVAIVVDWDIKLQNATAKNAGVYKMEKRTACIKSILHYYSGIFSHACLNKHNERKTH